MLPKLNLVSTVAAVVMFFLPWLSIECSGERMATQSGFQTITGKATPTREAAARDIRLDRSEGSLGHSYLAGMALVVTGIGAVVAFMALGTGRRDLASFSGGLCSAAFVCLLIQAAIGFPAEKELLKDLRDKRPAGSPHDSPFEELGNELSKELNVRIRVTTLPWFYLQLLALSIPSAIFLNDRLGRMKAGRAS
jgi:hypothetical protein